MEVGMGNEDNYTEEEIRSTSEEDCQVVKQSITRSCFDPRFLCAVW